jgi:hypothetical protein
VFGISPNVGFPVKRSLPGRTGFGRLPPFPDATVAHRLVTTPSRQCENLVNEVAYATAEEMVKQGLLARQ